MSPLSHYQGIAKANTGGSYGQAMVEFIIVIPVLILLVFGTVQIGLIYSAKTTLNYATFQAARLGAVNNATYSSLRRGLIRGMAPLYTSNTSLDTVRTDIDAGINSLGTKRDSQTDMDNYTKIIRLSPTKKQFQDASGFGFGEKNADNFYQIPNDNLMYRPTTLREGASIQDANLLKIRVQYCYKLMVPLVNRIIGSLSELNNYRTNQRIYETVNDPKFADANRYYTDIAAGTLSSYQSLCGDRADSNEGFIITAEAIVRMQSPAFEQDDDDDVGDHMCDGVRMSCP
tara:strand:+ start:389349 stop:390209 length:861 start_codon:yes stop_codon:yes gene_type:complete